MTQAPPRLLIDAAVLAEILAAARAAYPNECCGLLVGRDDAEGWRVTRWRPAANIHPRPCRHFELDPAAHIALLRQLRHAGPGGERLLGHVHSHPDAAAAPSAQDRALAHDPAMLWLIVSVSPGCVGPATAWQPPPDADGQADFRPVAVTIGEESATPEKRP